MKRFTRPIEELIIENFKSTDGLNTWDFTYMMSLKIDFQPVGVSNTGEFFFRGWLFYFRSKKKGDSIKINVEKGRGRGRFELQRLDAEVKVHSCSFRNVKPEEIQILILFLLDNYDYVKGRLDETFKQ